MYKAMKIKGEFDPDFISTTIYNDKLWGFNWQMSGIPFERGEDPPEVTETTNIMDMWMFLEEAYAKLSPTDLAKLAREAAVWRERSLYWFRWQQRTALRHRHLPGGRHEAFQHFKGRDLNSHSQSVPGYKRMYSVFEPIRATLHSRGLNVEEMVAILKVRVHPEYRGR